MGDMGNKEEQYEDDTEFLEFLNRGFDHTAVHATIEELAEFTFGGIEEAIRAFEEQKSE